MKNIIITIVILLTVLVTFNNSFGQVQTEEYTPDANTVLLFHLNETSGNIAYDESSFGNNGTIYTNQLSEGKFFNGRSFPYNNIDSGITLPYNPSLNIVGGKSITMECWIKTDSYNQGGTGMILLDDYQLYLGSYGSKGYLQFFRRDGNDWNICMVNNQIPLNEWVHVMATYDGNNTRMYINGIEQEYVVFINPYNQVNFIRIASFNGQSIQPNATVLIDEVRISNIARSFSSQCLVAYFPFNGNANDDSGNGNDGTVYGASLTTDRFGNLNSAYYYDGIDDYVQVQHSNDLYLGTSFSISFFVKTTANGWLIFKGIAGSNSHWGIWSGDHPTSPPGAQYSVNGGNHIIAATTIIRDGNWHHIGYVRENDFLRFYVDGILENETEFPGMGLAETTQPLLFGTAGYADYTYLDGVLDDIRIYNQAISEAEILELYHEGGWPGGGGNLVAYYPFNGNANDVSGHNNNGNALNGVSWVNDRFGNPNSSASFDGINDYIFVPNSASYPSSEITIAYWVNRQNNDPTILQNYISKEHAFQSYIYASDKKFWSGFYRGSPGSWRNFSTGLYTIPINNEWIFYAFTYDNVSKTAKSYVNGVLVSEEQETDPNVIIRTSNYPMYIGRNGSASVYYINGFMDDLRIYDRVISGDEVLELYHEGGWPGGEGDLVAYYPFNGNANDESGNGYHAVLLGHATVNGSLKIGNNDLDALSIPNSVINGLTDFTISSNLKIDMLHTSGSPGDPWNTWVSCANSSTDTELYIGYGANLDKWQIGIISSTFFNTDATVENNKFNHIVVTRKGSVVRLYVNGLEIGNGVSLPGNELNVDIGGFIIGQDQDAVGGQFQTHQSWAGEIDNIRIYNRALSDEEIIELYDIDNIGLVAYYPFNGNANDESGNGNNGAVEGANLTTDRFGNNNSAYYFDGINDRILVGDVDYLNGKSEATLSVWVKYNEHSGAYDPFITKGAIAQYESQFTLLYTPGGTGGLASHFVENFGTQSVAHTHPNTADDGAWHHIVARLQKKVINIYIDGIESSTYHESNCSSIRDDIYPLMFGSNIRATGENWFKGELDDIRIYNYGLNDNEILELYHKGGWPGEGSDLVAYYPFNGNANDESGNGNHLLFSRNPTLTADRFGNVNQAYEFNGNGDRMFLNGGLFADTPGEYTLSIWFNADQIQGDRYLLWEASNGIYFKMSIIDGILTLSQSPAELGFISVTKPFDDVDNWHHAILIWDGDKIRGYLDGVYLGFALINTTNTWIYGFGVGGNTAGSGATFDGKLDDIRIYDRAISDAEIFELYHEGGWPGREDDLIAYYPFNGNANDESGNNLHLTVVGSPLLSPDRFWNINSSFYFDGQNDYFIHNYDPRLTPSNEITVNVWVNHSEIDVHSDVVISTLDLPDVGGYQIDITEHGNQEVISWDVRPLGRVLDMEIPYEPHWKGNWIMLTGTFNQEVMKLYVNGELKESMSTNATINYESTNDFRIGTNPHTEDANRRYKGYIDDVRIYKRAFTDEEVLALHDISVPVELLSFTATVDHQMVALKWQTTIEINNLGFDVERYSGNSEWNKIGFVDGHGSTAESKSYSFVDDISKFNDETIRYRLKQIDYNGSFKYSNLLEVTKLIPTIFSLDQNYPNPFNPTTSISYSLPIKSFVTIKIFNALGEEVRDLLNEEKVAGDHQIKFDATGLPSGIYMYRIQAGNFIETKKMILMK